MAIDNKTITKLVRKRHPFYCDMKEQWLFFQLTYEGGRDWFKTNIHKYYKEGNEDYGDRIARAYRFNHTREVVDIINKYLFKVSAQRNVEDAPEAVDSFWSNATIDGLDIKEFMRTVSQQSSIYGCPWIVVDKTVNPEGVAPVNRAEQELTGERVYAYVVPPQRVLDMSYDENGVLNWVLIEETFRDDSDPFGSDGLVKSRFRLWTREDWYVFTPTKKKNGLTIPVEVSKAPDGQMSFTTEYGRHDLGVVPVFRADNTISNEPYVSTSLIADVSYLDKAVANYLSNLDAIIQDQTFSQLAIPAQGLLPDDENYKKILEIGTKRVFVYDGENNAKPEFLSPDPKQAELIIEAVRQIINEIYHSVGLAGERLKEDNSKGIDNSSGVAKKADFERVNALLISKADSLEKIENELVSLVCLWSGDPVPEKELVEYSNDFDVRDLYDEFDVAMKLGLIGLPALIRGKQFEALVHKLFPLLDKKSVEEFNTAIKGWVDTQDKMEQAALEQSKLAAEPDAALGDMKEEAARNRQDAGNKQSKTKQNTGTKASQ